MERIVLRFSGEDALEWVQVSPENMLVVGPFVTKFSDFVDKKNENIVVLVPGLDIGLSILNLPIKQKRQLILAIPYALEEKLASPIEECHFAWRKKENSDEYLVAVVKHTLMQKWTLALERAGLKPAALIPDFFALPFSEGTWSIAFESEICLVRLEESKGFSVDSKNLVTILEMIPKESWPREVKCFGANSTELATLSSLLGVPTQNEEEGKPLLSILGVSIPRRSPVNLLQGKYKHRETLQKTLTHFKPAFWLFFAAIAIEVFLQGFYFVYYRYEEAALDEKITALYQKTFPEDKRIVNPKTQMQNHLQRLKQQDSSHSFFNVLERIIKPLAEVPSARILGLRYNQGRGELDLEMETPDYQRLEELRQQLGLHFLVEIRSTNVTFENAVRGSLRLKGKE